jgi:shikimate dehydrogenase
MTINASTSIYCVIGSPIGHSLSPLMHNAAFAYCGENRAYVAFEVDDVAGAVSGVRGLNIAGASVTIPHKVAIMDYLDEIDDLARQIGAVNTIVNHNGRLVGHNTDCHGAVQALNTKTELNQKAAMIIGAGGAARAIGFGLKSAGCHIVIANRSAVKGKMLAADLGGESVPLSQLNEVDGDILVNTTPVGMAPMADAIPVADDMLRPGLVVMDIIYNPLCTRLLLVAAQAGCQVIDGTSMFVHQGARQFELWTGRQAPIDIMHKAVMKALDL